MLNLHIYHNIVIIEINIYRCLCAIKKSRHEGLQLQLNIQTHIVLYIQYIYCIIYTIYILYYTISSFTLLYFSCS